MTVYQHPRYHYPRHDATVCPSPSACVHTTEIIGECCECCSKVIEARTVARGERLQLNPEPLRVVESYRCRYCGNGIGRGMHKPYCRGLTLSDGGRPLRPLTVLTAKAYVDGALQPRRGLYSGPKNKWHALDEDDRALCGREVVDGSHRGQFHPDDPDSCLACARQYRRIESND